MKSYKKDFVQLLEPQIIKMFGEVKIKLNDLKNTNKFFVEEEN